MTCADCRWLAEFKSVPDDGEKRYACWKILEHNNMPHMLKSTEGCCKAWELMELPFEGDENDT